MLYKFFHLSLLFFITFFWACSSNTESEQSENKEESTKTNIIYIMADDLHYSEVGCYGQQYIQTPNIDRMAREGMRFTQHYAGTSVCAPSRCVLMTGMHTGHAAVRGNKQWNPSGQMPLPDSSFTVAEAFKKAGYTTGMFGKWGLGEPGTEGDPNQQGFDVYYGFTDQVLAHNSFPEFLWKNGKKVLLQNEVKYLDSTAWHGGLGSYSTKKVDYANDLFEQEALTFINENQNQPFFLYLPVTMPHDNGEAPEGERIESPDLGQYEDKSWSEEEKEYASVVTRLDQYVKQIMDTLQALGIAEHTLVMFTSDNGRQMDYIFTDDSPLRGKKRELYEGGIRVPFVAWWPGTIKAGEESTHISAFYDLFPTACELAGVEVLANLDGISFLPTLLGNEQPQHDYLYWEFQEGGKRQAVRKEKWKAVRNDVFENEDASVELYNLSEDLKESHNLAEQHPEIVQELREIMEKAHVPDPNWPLFKSEAPALSSAK